MGALVGGRHGNQVGRDVCDTGTHPCTPQASAAGSPSCAGIAAHKLWPARSHLYICHSAAAAATATSSHATVAAAASPLPVTAATPAAAASLPLLLARSPAQRAPSSVGAACCCAAAAAPLPPPLGGSAAQPCWTHSRRGASTRRSAQDTPRSGRAQLAPRHCCRDMRGVTFACSSFHSIARVVLRSSSAGVQAKQKISVSRSVGRVSAAAQAV